MVVETIKKGECTVIIYDDAFSKAGADDVERIIQNASAIVCAAERENISVNT